MRLRSKERRNAWKENGRGRKMKEKITEKGKASDK